MENTIQIFRYNGNDITFLAGCGDTMVNATQMAKPFGKKPAQWFDNPGTHEFIEALAESRGLAPMVEKRTSLNATALAQRYPSLVKVVKGGIVNETEQGTWFHEDVAVEFARWLSPQFAIWCNDRIKELLRYDFTATESIIEKIQANPDIVIHLATTLKEERERHQRELQEEKERHQAEMEEEQDYSFRAILDFSKQADKTLQARKEALAFKKKAKDYLFIADGMKHLLKENNIRIPANLLLYREDYEFLNEKDPQLEAFMKNWKKQRQETGQECKTKQSMKRR